MKPEVTAKLRIDYRKWRFATLLHYEYNLKFYFVIYAIFNLFIFPTNIVLLKMIVLHKFVLKSRLKIN